MNTSLADFLALAQLMADIMGAPKEDCIQKLIELSGAPALALPVVEKPPINGAERPFDSHKFRQYVRSQKPGTCMSVRDALDHLHMTQPARSKVAAYAMRDEGWVRTDKTRDNYGLYYKQPEAAEG